MQKTNKSKKVYFISLIALVFVLGFSGCGKVEQDAAVEDGAGSVDVVVEGEGDDNTEEQVDNWGGETEVGEEKWLTYTNEELGFSFEYPKYLGKPNFEIKEGSTGNMFYIFFNIDNLLFVGATEDYGAAIDQLSLARTRGHEQSQEGVYYYNIINNKLKVEPDKIIKASTGEEVLILGHDSFVDLRNFDEGPYTQLKLNKGERLATVNLEGNVYSGMAFINRNAKELSMADFEKIIQSIKIFNTNPKK